MGRTTTTCWTASLICSRGPVSASTSTTPVIYIDGVRVDNLNTGSALSLSTGGAPSSALPDIPIENIERIEFIKGGAAMQPHRPVCFSSVSSRATQCRRLCVLLPHFTLVYHSLTGQRS